MNNQIYHIKLFGMFAEKIASHIDIADNIETVGELRLYLEKKYVYFNGIAYLVAVDQKISDINTPIHLDSDIAILPPFSGG